MTTGTDPAQPLLTVDRLKVHFPGERRLFGGEIGTVKAVDDVSFTVNQGETVAVVGESGCGKSTTGNAILGLAPITAGKIAFAGRDISTMTPAQRKTLWHEMQVVFQDPVAALDPRRTVAQSIAEPLAINGWSRTEQSARVDEVMNLVGLNPGQRDRFPAELSGGQRQRVVVARALAFSPRLIVCDEPVSALDVSIQSQILNLLMRLQSELGIAYLFIAHDLSVVRHIADRLVVMYLGTIVEQGPAERIFEHPVHPYTEALLSAIPLPDPVRQRARRQIILEGELPSPADPPAGCPFVTRCPIREERCWTDRPSLLPRDMPHQAACHFRTPGAA